jgi:hypothetical protein
MSNLLNRIANDESGAIEYRPRKSFPSHHYVSIAKELPDLPEVCEVLLNEAQRKRKRRTP